MDRKVSKSFSLFAGVVLLGVVLVGCSVTPGLDGGASVSSVSVSTFSGKSGGWFVGSWHSIISESTGECLLATGNANGAQVEMFTTIIRTQQAYEQERWMFLNNNDGSYVIENEWASQKALEDTGESKANGNPMQVYAAAFNWSPQSWNLTFRGYDSAGNAYYTLVNERSGLYLTDTGEFNPVDQQYANYNYNNQLWYIQ